MAGGQARFGPARKPAARLTRSAHRERIHRRVRTRVRGTGERPRVSVFRSGKHIYAQVINDVEGRTLASASTMDKEVRQKVRYGGNVAAAKTVGQILGARARKAGIAKAVFDRGGYRYHGRLRALAEAAREAGLEF